jgi:DNA-directed RNA polymerase specialized sigma24 family protein
LTQVTRRFGSDDSANRIGRLYDRFADGLYRYALMVLADPSAAADVIHDVFVGVLRQRANLGDPEHYLRRAVRNECYSVLRRRRRD